MDRKFRLNAGLVLLAAGLAAGGCSDATEEEDELAMEDGIITEQVEDDRNVQPRDGAALTGQDSGAGEELVAQRGDPSRGGDTSRGTAAGRAAEAGDADNTVQAVAIVTPVSGSDVRGTVVFTQQDSGILIETNLSGLEPGLHGFHVHQFGDCSATDASSAGDHFSPHDRRHGDPGGDPGERHVGDLGNIEANQDGLAQVSKSDYVITFDGENSILGKSILVHSGEDDLTSQPSGESGEPVACGVIQPRSELTQSPPGGDPENA